MIETEHTPNPDALKFFLEQNFVNFKKIWFYHDEISNSDNTKPDTEFLRQFEDSQKIDLWNLALNERIFYRFFDYHKFSDEEIMKIEENSHKNKETVGLTKKGLSRPIFHDFWLLSVSFWGRNWPRN